MGKKKHSHRHKHTHKHTQALSFKLTAIQLKLSVLGVFQAQGARRDTLMSLAVATVAGWMDGCLLRKMAEVNTQSLLARPLTERPS